MITSIENQIIRYTETVIECPWCYGLGVRYDTTREELMNDLVAIFDWQMSKRQPVFRSAMRIARQWKDNCELVCNKCDGRGKWTERW